MQYNEIETTEFKLEIIEHELFAQKVIGDHPPQKKALM
jgi:hypothetical protein